MVSNEGSLERVVIVGGGSAGWMTAAALSHLLDRPLQITLVESAAIGTVGVGEATLPHLRFFNQRIGIEEPEFMQQTQATFKLGIEFADWSTPGEAYIHPFGDFGRSMNGIDFHHFWLRWRHENPSEAADISRFSLPVQMASKERFSYPESDPRSMLSSYSYAYHIDASRYAQFLRQRSEKRGVKRIEGLVKAVEQDAESGHITSITLDSGQSIHGDLFIDCSGFRGILIENALQAGYEDWTHWLPCDRAVAMPTEHGSSLPPYTRATAVGAGWRWQIPLQHRMGNGLVYASDFMDDESARALLDDATPERLADPIFLRFTTGRRKSMWKANCVAIGLAGGFLEPLESTGIHLIQLAIMKLVELFPSKAQEPTLASEFNRQMQWEIERIRDFIILHYCATQRSDTDFWNHCRTMKLPDSLRHSIDLFKATAQVSGYREGLFLEPSWLAVLLGQSVIPSSWHPGVNAYGSAQIDELLTRLSDQIGKTADHLPDHAAALQSIHSARPNDGWQRASMSLYR